MKLWQRFLRPTCFAVLGASLLSQSAFAQFSSNTSTRTTTGATGGTGSSGLGTGASGGGGSSGSMFGNSNSQGGNNSAGIGATGNAQSRQINTQSQLGLNPQNFLGQGNNQQNFLGRNQRTQTQNNQQNRQNNNNRGQGNFGQNDNNQNGQGQQTQDPKRAIRPQFRVAFDELPRPTTEIRSTLQPRFDSLSQSPALRGVAYELDAEGVVVLRGTVDTPSQKRLAENVVRLEPGVKKVRNELTLNEPPATK